MSTTKIKLPNEDKNFLETNKPDREPVSDKPPVWGKMHHWVPNTLRYSKRMADSTREIHRMVNNYLKSPKLKPVQLTEEQFTKFIPLFQKSSIDKINEDPNLENYFAQLNEELIMLVGKNKPFSVKWDDGTITPFAARLIEINQIDPKNAIILDIFQHLKNSKHPLHMNRADDDFKASILMSQDIPSITKRIKESKAIIDETNKFIHDEKNKLLQKNTETTDEINNNDEQKEIKKENITIDENDFVWDE